LPGPSGPTGLQGPQGATGVPGATGPAGANGTNGSNGQNGTFVSRQSFNFNGTSDVTAYKGFALLSISTAAAGWVRLYHSAAARTADASRPYSADPSPSAGVIAEVITNSAETVTFSPAAIGFNAENPVVAKVYVKATTLAGADISGTFVAVQLEA
jgi:hypothetical protein